MAKARRNSKSKLSVSTHSSINRSRKSTKSSPNRSKTHSRSRAGSSNHSPAPQASTSRKAKRRGYRVLREIIYLQRTTHHLIPKLSFARLVREIMQHYGEFRIQVTGLKALHEAAEMHLVELFEDTWKCCLHAKRKTIFPIDMALLRWLRRGVLDENRTTKF